MARVSYNVGRGIGTGVEEQPKRGVRLQVPRRLVPKIRRKVLSEEVAAHLKASVAEVAKETASDILQLEVMPDHVHLLCEVDPQFGIAKFVRLVKGRTSHHLRREFPQLRSRLPTLWTNSWFVATVGGVRPWR